ncbi:MAG: glycoside hydrolase family 127 protein [Anaerolineales bacterium]
MKNISRQLQPVPYTEIQFNDAFWSPRLETNRTVTIPHIYRQLEATGRISAFDLDFQRPLPAPIVFIFGDSDLAKWVEAASLSLATHPDPLLAAQVDRMADKIIHAQQPDGYLNTHFTVADPKMRWKNLRDWHEMYCAGHLMEAAVAHHQATGDPKLLNALSRYADHIDQTFGREPGKKRGYPGHPEIELALVKLYHATNNPRYLELSSYFIDERGSQPHYYDIEARERGDDPAKYWAKNYEYCQAHLPIREQSKVVGHAVRAMYLLSAVADIAHEKNDATLLETCERLWENLVTKRMYLTGGIGPSAHNEGFTNDYDLPDDTAYAETCATIALIQWNHRMLQFSGESKYADVIERGLYNGFLSNISLSGDRFFYENPLASAGDRQREAWFTCPCCPPNVARTFASLGQYFYSTGSNGVWVHLYAQGSATLNVGNEEINLHQITNYPWDGNVKIEIGVKQPQTFAVNLRVPGWCDGLQLTINGAPAQNTPIQNGYLSIERNWQNGDVVDFTMQMPVQVTWAHPSVRFLQGKVALQRGPLVYCIESVDHQGIPLDNIMLNPQQVLSGQFEVEHKNDLLGGVSVLRGTASLVDEKEWSGSLYRSVPASSHPVEITAIPYYAWNNREPGEMRVWVQSTQK